VNIFMTGGATSLGGYINGALQDEERHNVWAVGSHGPAQGLDLLKIGTESSAYSVLQRAADAFLPDPIDILFFNAGITRIDFLLAHKDNDWYEVLHLNLTIPFLFTKAFAQLYRNRGYTNPVRFVYTLSMGARLGLRASPGYCASKAGLRHLLNVFSKEYAGTRSVKYPDRERFTFLGVSPNGVQGSGMIAQCKRDLMRTRNMTKEEADAYIVQSPMRRLCTMEECWKVVKFAMFDAPDAMSGANLELPMGQGW